MNLLKDYDCKIIYHLGRGNVVADALSLKESAVLAQTMTSSWKLMDTMQSLRLSYYSKDTYLTQIRALPNLFMKI